MYTNLFDEPFVTWSQSVSGRTRRSRAARVKQASRPACTAPCRSWSSQTRWHCRLRPAGGDASHSSVEPLRLNLVPPNPPPTPLPTTATALYHPARAQCLSSRRETGCCCRQSPGCSVSGSHKSRAAQREPAPRRVGAAVVERVSRAIHDLAGARGGARSMLS